MVSREPDCGQEDPMDSREPLRDLSSSALCNLAAERFPSGFDRTLYGDFRLTEAVRPQSGLGFVPQEGYSRIEFTDQRTNAPVEGMKVALSAEKIVDTLDTLIAFFELDVTLSVEVKSSHSGQALIAYRADIDPVVLRTVLNDFEDPILNDGCLALLISCDQGRSTQIELDENKLLKVSSDDGEYLTQVSDYFDLLGVHECPGLRYIDEASHVNVSTDTYPISFYQLSLRLTDAFSQN